MKTIRGIIATALFLVLFLFLWVVSFADSLVSVKDIHYHSAFEKQAFWHYFNQENNVEIELLFATNPNFELKQLEKFNNAFCSIIEKYNTIRYQRKINKKRAGIIYDDFRKTLLKKETFSSDYSTFTADKSYIEQYILLAGAYLFDELKIPYSIKQTSEFVSLVAFPEQSNIEIEKVPTTGIEHFDENFKKAYVKFLVNCGMLKDSIAKQVNNDELFRKYFFETKNIDKLSFVAEVYTIHAIDEIICQKYSIANQWAEKAYLLHPNENSTFLLLYSLANVIDGIDLNDPEYSKILAKLMRFENRGVTKEQLIGMFVALTDRQFLLDANTELYDDSYVNVITEINDSLLFNEISFVYNFERGRVLFLNGQYVEAEPYISAAFSAKPDDPNVKSMFFGIMLARMDELKTGDDAYSFAKFEDYFSTICRYKLAFPVLNEMMGFRQAWLYFCLGLMDQSYQFNDPVSGEKYRRLFEEDYPVPNKDFSAINKGIAKAYISAADFYFRGNNLDRSREIADRGLDYLPGNLTLISLEAQKLKQ